jgi:transcription termination factor Rho
MSLQDVKCTCVSQRAAVWLDRRLSRASEEHSRNALVPQIFKLILTFPTPLAEILNDINARLEAGEDLQDLDRASFESTAGAKRSHAVDDHEVDNGSSDEDGSTRAPPAKAGKRTNGVASTVVEDDFLRPVKRAERVSTGAASPAASKKPQPGKPQPKVDKKIQPATLKREKPAAKSGERGDNTGDAVLEKKIRTKAASSASAAAAAAAAARPKATPQAVEPEAEAEEDDFLLPVTDSSKAQRVTATLTPAKDKDDSEDAEGGDEQGGKRKRRNRKRGKRKKAAADGGDDDNTADVPE